MAKRFSFAYEKIEGGLTPAQYRSIVSIYKNSDYFFEKRRIKAIKDGRNFLLAKIGGEAVGLIKFYIKEGKLVGLHTHVKESHWRQGIATKMKAHLLGVARAKGLVFEDVDLHPETEELIRSKISNRKHYGANKNFPIHSSEEVSWKKSRGGWGGSGMPTAKFQFKKRAKRPK